MLSDSWITLSTNMSFQGSYYGLILVLSSFFPWYSFLCDIYFHIFHIYCCQVTVINLVYVYSIFFHSCIGLNISFTWVSRLASSEVAVIFFFSVFKTMFTSKLHDQGHYFLSYFWAQYSFASLTNFPQGVKKTLWQMHILLDVRAANVHSNPLSS